MMFPGFSKCGGCGGGSFKMVEQEPSGAAYKIMFVQCSTCNVPVGVTDYFNAGVLLQTQKQEIAALKKQISGLEHSVSQILHALRR